MKRLVSVTLVVVVAVVAVFGCGGSAAEDAKKAGAAFITAAAAGDAQRVQSMLSSRADITAQQVVELYQGLTSTEAFDVKEALPNQTGVEFIVLASGVDRVGRPHSTSIAVGRENNTWLVIRAGTNFTY